MWNYLCLFNLILISTLTRATLSGGESDTGRFNYVECSACYSLPVRNVDSYTCKVRCDVSDESHANVTGMYDVLNQVLQELKETKEKLENTSQKLESTSQKLDETSQELEDTKQEMQRRFNTIEQKVGFTVRLDSNLETQAGEVIKFPVILYNAGSGYNASTGVFTAPSNGTYEFTLITVNRYHDNHLRTDLMRGDEMLFRVRSDGDRYSTGVGTIIVDLVEGEEIYAKSVDESTYNNWFNIFSGHKL